MAAAFDPHPDLDPEDVVSSMRAAVTRLRMQIVAAGNHQLAALMAVGMRQTSPDSLQIRELSRCWR